MIPGWQMEGYERLRTEIVKSAVNDYKNALKKSKRIGCKCTEETELEKWFLSKWGQLLSGDNGEYIIEKCRQSYNTSDCKKGKRHIPDDVQKRIYADYKRGESTSAIMKQYRVGSATLYKIVRRWEK